MKAYIGITDKNWFEFLRDIPYLDEVNFWRPGGNTNFKALKPGELFLFKLHYPYNCIVGGGTFAHFTICPMSLAWETFGIANGAPTFHKMREQILRYKTKPFDKYDDINIGCIILEQPFFLPESRWIPAPLDWKPNTTPGKTYDLSTEPGLSIWRQLCDVNNQITQVREQQEPYEKPFTTLPRLGQGSFHLMVTDAYNRKCAVTGEKTLPALKATHIKPYSECGEHVINNGLLLRRDLQALFDQGYITIDKSMRVTVSKKIKEEFENGREYYAMHGNRIFLPGKSEYHPSNEYIEWHNNYRFRG